MVNHEKDQMCGGGVRTYRPPHSSLAHPHATKEVLRRHGLFTKHSFGQNFLVSDQVIGSILQLSQPTEEDVVLEIGPGIGTLSFALLKEVRALCALEMDTRLPGVLAHTLSHAEDKFYLVLKDALNVERDDIFAAQLLGAYGTQVDGHATATAPAFHAPENLTSFGQAHPFPNKLIANLPYQIAATVILDYFTKFPELQEMTVMVQSEVADRISAQPGTKTYGAYTLKLSLFAEVVGRFQVSPQNFFPPPHVTSSVIKLVRKSTPTAHEAEQLSALCALIDASFAQRRKTLKNNLKNAGYTEELIEKACEGASLSPTCRAETLSLDDFRNLYRGLSEQL